MNIFGLIPSFGGLLWTVVAFIVALSIIVAVHELGHYLVGRWSGIKAEVFSIGMGPVLWSRTDRHGTRWQIAALPFGGYVKFLGDADAASARPDEAALAHMDADTRAHTIHGAPLWARAATVVAGPLFNFVLSVVVFAGLLAVEGVPREPLTVAALKPVPGAEAGEGLRSGDVILAVNGQPVGSPDQLDAFYDAIPDEPVLEYLVRRDGREIEVTAPNIRPPLVSSVAPRSAAAKAGLAEGDVIVSVDGTPIGTFQQLVDRVVSSNGRELVLGVWRDGVVRDVALTPVRSDLPKAGGGFETRWLIGITSTFLFEQETRMPGPLEIARYGATQTWEIARTSLSGIAHLITGDISACNLRGPISIAQTSGDAAAQGLVSFLFFIGLLSTAVGLMNLFPIPILDGGHLVFHLWEAVTGRAPNDRALKIMMSFGLVLILAIMSFALTNDLRC